MPEPRSASDLDAAVRSVVLEVAPDPDAGAGPEARLVDDLGFHSLALLELAYLLEEEFDLTPIDVETARGIETVRDVIDYVRTELARKVGGPA